MRVVPVLAWRTLREVRNDRVYGLAAEAAFWALLSLPPLALASLAAMGYVGELLGPWALQEIRNALVNGTARVLTPEVVGRVVEPLVEGMLVRGNNLVSLGVLISLWSGSAAMARYVSTITVAYDMEGLRSLGRTRLLAFVLNLGALVLAIVVVPVLILGPEALIGLAPGPVTPVTATLVRGGYWPLLIVLAICALATLYHVGVPVRTPWHRDLPGAVLAVGLWLAGSFVLRAYLTSDLRSTEYGPLAGSIVALLFLYVAALAVLVGAELNSEIDALWPATMTAEGRQRARAGAEERAPEPRERAPETQGRARPDREGGGGGPSAHDTVSSRHQPSEHRQQQKEAEQ